MKKKQVNIALRVYRALMEIPSGRVATYAQLARHIGAPGAARAVGNALHANPNPISVPCHRVVRADGSLGGYGGGARMKADLLQKEGVLTKNGKIELKKFGMKWK